jgi:predicted DNA-binding transcriptional regulator AlpA
MNIDFEQLKLLPQVLELLTSVKDTIEKGTVEKRWFNTRELALYTGYKFETIKSKIKKGEFTQNIHYFKKGGILLFDKVEVDNWVMGIKSANNIAYTQKQSQYTSNAFEKITKSFIA